MAAACRNSLTSLVCMPILVIVLCEKSEGRELADQSNGSACIMGTGTGESGCTCAFPRKARQVGPGGAEHAECIIEDCGHGNYSLETHECACHEGFRTGGLTNPFAAALGRCMQYQCVSDSVCAVSLDLEFARCSIAGFNCDCGFWYAGHSADDAQCMYVWWVLATRGHNTFKWLMRNLWIGIAVLAIFLLPFGKNVVGTAEAPSLHLFQHDVAWSIFTVKLGAWLYGLIVTCYLSILLMWASIVAVIVLLALLVLAVAALCAGAGEGGCPACESGQCCECGHGECCNCAHGECCNSGICEGCCGPGSDPWLWYGPSYPISPLGNGDCECHCCDNSCGGFCLWLRACYLGLPCFRLLTRVAPKLPENMLGGLLGFLVGTHPLRNTYQPDSPLVIALSRPCWTLSNRSESWRSSVYQYLHERDAFQWAQEFGQDLAEPQGTGARIRVGGVMVERKEGAFSSADRMFNFEDYERNCCWICQDNCEEWDLWGACRHAFCKKCSVEMLRRQMPCPLCRVRSSWVVRRDGVLLAKEMPLREVENNMLGDGTPQGPALNRPLLGDVEMQGPAAEPQQQSMDF